jgi:hypothetical protein
MSIDDRQEVLDLIDYDLGLINGNRQFIQKALDRITESRGDAILDPEVLQPVLGIIAETQLIISDRISSMLVYMQYLCNRET